MEDEEGRADEMEGSIGFKKEESEAFPNKMMKVTLIPQNGDTPIVMSCSNIKQDKNFLKQYFVFCLSKSDVRPIKDSGYAVVLNSDIFDFFEKLFMPPEGDVIHGGRKMFSHGEVLYYDIHNHPTNISNELWKEVFLKHSKFKPQDEYRAALFISDKYFNRIELSEEKKFLEVSKNGEKMDCKIEIKLKAGVDEYRWRYVEIDTRDINKKLNLPCSQFMTPGEHK